LAVLESARGDAKAALGILDGTEKAYGANLSDVVFVPVTRAMVLNAAGRYREALAPVAAALATAEGGQLGPGLARPLRGTALIARMTAEAGLRDVAAATKTSAALDADAAAAPDIPQAQSAMHYGKAMLAVAKGDAPGARAHFELCSQTDELCKWQGVVAAEKAGDKAGAASARDQLLKLYRRNSVHLILRARLTPATS
jgi:hypothetical protein